MFYLTADMEFACTDAARDTDGNFEAFLDAVRESLADLEDVDEGISGCDMAATNATSQQGYQDLHGPVLKAGDQRLPGDVTPEKAAGQ